MTWRKARPWTLALLASLLVLPARVAAQSNPVSWLGSANPQSGQLSSPVPGQQQPQDDSANAPDSETGVSFIDSALPLTQMRILIDGNYGLHQPSRNEYLFPKSGAPGDPGWSKPERNVDWYAITSYGEIAFASQFSVFFQVPTKIVGPDVNPDNWGVGDVDVGFKWAFYSCPGLTTTLQVRATIPTREGPGLSSDHYSVEPALLLNLRAIEWLCIEGQLGFWAPIDGTDFAGDMVHYGLGLTIGERSYSSFWFTPVLEVVGWSIISGKEEVFFQPDIGIPKSTAGEEIVNAYGGVRFGFGDQGDIYIGYGHSLTGDAWQHQEWRVEFRVRF
jgi:hypothetical protein